LPPRRPVLPLPFRVLPAWPFVVWPTLNFFGVLLGMNFAMLHLPFLRIEFLAVASHLLPPATIWLDHFNGCHHSDTPPVYQKGSTNAPGRLGGENFLGSTAAICGAVFVGPTGAFSHNARMTDTDLNLFVYSVCVIALATALLIRTIREAASNPPLPTVEEPFFGSDADW
jgi:hypothetical protein